MSTQKNILTGVIAALVLALGLAWILLTNSGQTVMNAVFALRGFFTLAVGLSCVLIALVVEWKTILRYRGIDNESLGDIELYHPRLPGKIEIAIATIFTIVFILLFFQFATIVYAMSFTLSSSSAQTNDTRDIVLADFDNDGDLDYIAGNYDTGAPSQHYDVYSNNGTASFTHMGTINGGSLFFTKFAAGDLDGDGDIDLAYGQAGVSYTVGVKKNNGSFSFSQGYSYAYVSPIALVEDVVLTDVDSDGDLDIIAITSSNVTNAVHINDGHGNFAAAQSTLPSSKGALAADFDSDGDIDLALRNTSPNLRIYRNSGTGAFVQHDSVGLLSSNIVTIAVADVEGDGDIDVFALGNAGPANFNVALNDGTGNFTTNSESSVYNYGVQDIATADFDNDGDIDFLDVGSEPGPVLNGNELWFNSGLGGFSSHWQASGIDETSSSLAVGDLDADGDLDYILGRSGATADDRLLSDQAATSANTAPTAPTSLQASISLNLVGPKSPAMGANDSALGMTAWTNPTNIYTLDSNNAEVNLAGAASSYYLKATNFGFSIPATADVLGITVEWHENKGSASCNIVDDASRIVKGGVIGSADKSAGQWPLGSYVSYGGPSDLWSTTWTPADINSATFGAALAARNLNVSSCNITVDHVRITVTYTPDVFLQWGSGSDVQTATRLLQYQVRVGTGSSAHNIVSGKTASPTWLSRLVPNGQSKMIKLAGLSCDNTYYWSVGTVDTGFKTAWSSEQQFTLDSSCGISGGGGGSSSSEPSVGGGLSIDYFRTNRPENGSSPDKGLITVTGFKDLDGNGRRSAKEPPAFKGLAFTASGRTVEDIPVHKTASLNDKGQVIFDLPLSDDRGYWILADTGSALLDGFSATGQTSSGGYVIKTGSKLYADFGFQRSDILSYKPCLAVGAPSTKERKGSDAEILLQRLEDAFSQKVVRGVDRKDELISRKDFFTMLARTHCVPLLRDAAELEKSSGLSAKNLGIDLPLLDLPLDPSKPESLLLHSLIAAGVDISRQIHIGSAADLSSPITREEAVRATYAVLNIPDARRVKQGGVLANDIEPTDSIATEFRTLQSLGVLPESFLPILGPSSGMDQREAALLLVRASFRGGKINLLPEVYQTKKGLPSAPTFLSVLPPLKQRACLEKNTERASAIGFSDVLPGDVVYESLRDLLSRGTKNSAQQTLWLLTGTRRTTEFGIMRGQTRVGLDEPVSILEVVRNLLVLACVPPETAFDVMSGKGKMDSRQGSAEMRVARDRISGLPRDASFASRVFYRAQDHQKEFDLSVFTYLPEFLRMEQRKPGVGLSVTEGSRLLASGLLMIEVKNNSLTPLQAENAMEELSAAIRKDLLGKDIDWRDESALKAVPLTRGMLLKFLSTVVTGARSRPIVPPPSTLPLGEIWWERIN